LLESSLAGCGGSHAAGLLGPIPYDLGGGSLAPIAEPTPRPGDWPTYGFDSAHTSYNPDETVLGASAVRSKGLQTLWRFTTGGVIDAQPVVASGVAVGTKTMDLAFVGDEAGDFYALGAATGKVVWQKKLRVQSDNSCTDLPNGSFGITDAAVVDRATNRVYVTDGQGFLYAFDLATGAAAPGYASGVSLLPDQREHIYGALTLDAARHTLYVAAASRCDNVPYHGLIVAVDSNAAIETHLFYVMGGPNAPNGGGVWGAAGVSLDPRNTGALYAFTANSDSPTTSGAYPLSILRLNPSLDVVAGIDPDPTTQDLGFGATPLMVPPVDGCANYIAIGKAKSGILYTFENADDLSNASLVQRIQVAASELQGDNIGTAAFSPATKLVYVANGLDSPDKAIRHGLLAFSIQSDCTLSSMPVWSNVNGPNGGIYDNPPGNPSVAAGVVWYTNGTSGQLLAFDANSGTPLWQASLGGPSFTAPSIAGGRVFVPSWGSGGPGIGGGPGELVAFGLR
jgi:outer membrane protein assembly factor BamB